MADETWRIYQGTGTPDAQAIGRLPDAPPWRRFDTLAANRAEKFQPPKGVVEVVNAALYLRRPLLITGDPGTGKSSLAYAVAHELGLGPVLTWHINSRSSLLDGLYQYDAIARLRVANLEQKQAARATAGKRPTTARTMPSTSEDIGRFIKLGALGTAFIAAERPRVVLIDEIDKSDIDLPNDLLHVLENGEFEIAELARDADRRATVDVSVTGATGRVAVHNGLVRCRTFPFIAITSNGERDLPPAFLRRCLRIDITPPKAEELREIVKAHLGEDDAGKLKDLLRDFDALRSKGALLATDQLLNAFFLVTRGGSMTDDERTLLQGILLRELGTR
jgi:MoxR-like ATPase